MNEQEPETAVMERLADHARRWRVDLGDFISASGSVVAFGTRDGHAVALKIVRSYGDEWESGRVLAALAGPRVVRVVEHAPGAILTERLLPGSALAQLPLEGRDDDAVVIIATIIAEMSSVPSGPYAAPTVADWGAAFDRYLSRSEAPIRRDVVEHAAETYRSLCATQSHVRLLHGDLQHYNVLYDDARGWTVIDPKGVVGEIEYESCAMLRNPSELPGLYSSRHTIIRRLRLLEKTITIDVDRTLRWAYSQAVLSAMWSLEDGEGVDTNMLELAASLRNLAML